jgi:DNA helicase-4
MTENYQSLRQQVHNLAIRFDDYNESLIDEIVKTLNSLPPGRYTGFFKGIPEEVKYHWKLFPYLSTRNQIKRIGYIISLAGNEANTNKNIVLILLSLLQKASPSEHIIIDNRLPSWLKKSIVVEKDALIRSIKERFEQDFLNVDNFYQAKCSKYISFEEYQVEKSSYVRSWIQRHLNPKDLPDLEQAAAIGAVEGHVQVVARAGSGKTSTLVNRALFLQKHCGIAPSEMLLLAFNRKAAEEIRKRLTSQLQGSIPHVMTFHALAYALVHPEESILFDEPDGEQSRSRALQDVIDDYLRDPDYYEKIRTLMMAHFREDWECIVLGGYDRSREEMLRYRRSLSREGFDGTYLKSFGEKVVADFLFEHDIKYRYERNFRWNGINYRPDFTIETNQGKGIVIEYFGLKGDPDYDAMSERKRQYWQSKPEWHLLEFSPHDLKSSGIEGFRALLKQSLENLGITRDRLSEEEIWQRIKNRAIDRFTKTIVGFIQRCRKQSLTPQELAKLVNGHTCASDVEQRFLDLAQKFYQSYLEYLEATGEDDFDGLMQKAAEIVASGQTVFRRRSGTGDLKRLRYVLIDEYQDFSELFHQLIEALRTQNSQAQFFCVGDDWQAINGFAGSKLHFYENFARFFQPSCKLNITKNYRSYTLIVNVGNTLMQGLGLPARADKDKPGLVVIADLGTFKLTPKEEETHPGDSLTPAVLRLVHKAITNNKKVVLLSRKNSLPWYVNYGRQQGASNGALDYFLKLVRSYLPAEVKQNVTISTAHKYKGLQQDVVIVLDAVPCCYPLLHPDLIFTRIFGDTMKQVVDEERRLFYVALTRAAKHLFILTETNNISPFLEELKRRKNIPSLNWSDYPPLVGATQRITVRVGNQDGQGGNGTYAIRNRSIWIPGRWCKGSVQKVIMPNLINSGCPKT